MLPLLLLATASPHALAAPEVHLEPHAWAAGGLEATHGEWPDDEAWIYDDYPAPQQLQLRPFLELARLSAVIETRGESMSAGAFVQIEAAGSPGVLDAVAWLRPHEMVQVDVGEGRTHVSWLHDIIAPRHPLLTRSFPEGLIPGRRLGAMVTVGDPNAPGVHGRLGTWGPGGGAMAAQEPSHVEDQLVRNRIATGTLRWRGESGLVAHLGYARRHGDVRLFDPKHAGDFAIGMDGDRTRVIVETSTSAEDWSSPTLAHALLVSHRISGATEERWVEPVVTIQTRSYSPDPVVAQYSDAVQADDLLRNWRESAGVNVGLLGWHLVWTTELALEHDNIDPDDAPVYTLATRLRTGL